jgi:hypothetical protein
LDEFAPVEFQLDPSSPARVTVTLRAIRNIGGIVTFFDPEAGKNIPLPGVTVTIRELSKECLTDKSGAYLFRNLSPGSYTVVVADGDKELVRSVNLLADPKFLKSVNFSVGNETLLAIEEITKR